MYEWFSKLVNLVWSKSQNQWYWYKKKNYITTKLMVDLKFQGNSFGTLECYVSF
jgi:hypothetical protein